MAKEFDAAKEAADLEAFFERQQQATAPAWRPEPGDTIAYEVIGMKMGADAGYGKYPIIVVRVLTDGRVLAIHAFHTMLRESFRELKIKIGSRCATSYLGTREKNNSKDPEDPDTYHMYYSEDLATADSMSAVSDDFEL